MKWHITRKRLLAIIIVLFAVLIAFAIGGCTKREQEAAKQTGGAISGAIGLPPYVGESLVTLFFTIAGAIAGDRRGRRVERKCHIHKPEPKAAP